MRFPKRFVALVSLLVLLIAVVPAGTGQAVTDAEVFQSAALRMKDLGLVKGAVQSDGSVSLNLGSEITRAELVVMFVRAFGLEENAKLISGASVFPDTRGHWANGYVAMAVSLLQKTGDSIGMPDGTFNPAGKVTAAQAVAFIAKFLGVKPDSGKAWPDNYIGAALANGILDAGSAAMVRGSANTNATRGLVFYLMDNAFYSYKMADGKTVYTKYVDATPPTVTVNAYPAETAARFITLTGTVSGQSALRVQGRAVQPDALGIWSTTVMLRAGANTIPVEAIDLAGNVGVPAKPVAISRTGNAAAVLAFVRDDTIFAVSLDKPSEPFRVSAAGSPVRSGEWAQFSQPAMAPGGDWVYYARTQSKGGVLTNAVLRAPLLSDAQADVVIEFPGTDGITDLAAAPGGGVMFMMGGHLYRVHGKSLEMLGGGSGLQRFSAGPGDWLLANQYSETKFMGFNVPVVKVAAVCGAQTQILTRGEERVVGWGPVALPDGSGLAYGDTLQGRIVIQKWDGTTRTLEVAELSADRQDARPTVAGDGTLAFESSLGEITSIIVVKDVNQPAVVTQIRGSYPSLGGGAMPAAVAGPCSGTGGVLPWGRPDLPQSVQTDLSL